MDAVGRGLQETIQSSLSLSGALQGDPAASINPQLLAAAEDVTRMAGKALFTLNAVNSAKASASAALVPTKAALGTGVCLLAFCRGREDPKKIQQFI